jgi:hypothetical protein
MTKKIPKRSFDEVLAELGTQKFDVAAASNGAKRVSKYGVAAELAPGPKGAVLLVKRPGWVLHSEISRLLDRGYQKFLKTSKLEIVATAVALRAIHNFTEELDLATGGTMLYNEAMGTTSDVYLYDRVAGRADAAQH